MKYINCVLLCKSYSLFDILTYTIVIARGAKKWDKAWERWMKGKKRKEEKNEWEERVRGRGWEKCDCGVVMYGSRKSFLRAYRERRRCARCPDCTLSRIRNDKEKRGRTKRGDPRRRWSKVKRRIERWDTARWCKVLSIMGLRAYM